MGRALEKYRQGVSALVGAADAKAVELAFYLVSTALAPGEMPASVRARHEQLIQRIDAACQKNGPDLGQAVTSMTESERRDLLEELRSVYEALAGASDG